MGHRDTFPRKVCTLCHKNAMLVELLELVLAFLLNLSDTLPQRWKNLFQVKQKCIREVAGDQ